MLLTALSVLPLCCHRSDNLLRDRILRSRISFNPLGTRTLRKLGFTPMGPLAWNLSVLSSMLSWAWSSVPGPNGKLSLGAVQSPCPWDKVCRIGEADNPGPLFQLTTLNVVSIGKYQDLLVEPHPIPTVAVYTETCLTKTVFETISRKIKKSGRHLVVGGICDPRKGRTRQSSVVRGESGGTLIASDLPARPSRHPIPPAALLSTRVCEAIVSLNSCLSFRVVGLYGLVLQAESTNHLLYLMLQHSQRSTLPCVFIGDFNCKLDELAIWPVMQQHGWVDIAVYFQGMTGIEPQPTWNGQTRIDFALVPNQLLPWFRNLELDHDTISDHSKLILTFDVPGGPNFRTVWKTCRDSLGLVGDKTLNDLHIVPHKWQFFHDSISQGDVESAYKAFTQNFEDWIRLVHSKLGSTFPVKAFVGRGSPARIQRPIHLPVIPSPREGETIPSSDDAPIRLRQQVKQLRRVTTSMQQLANFVNTNSLNSLLSAQSTWVAVLNAKGFPGGFSAFCKEELGIFCPATISQDHVPLLQLLMAELKHHHARWERAWRSSKRHQSKLFMDEDWRKGGKYHAADIRPPPVPEICIMESAESGTIVRMRHDKTGPFWIKSLTFPPRGVTAILCGDERYDILEIKDLMLKIHRPLQGTGAQREVLFIVPTSDLSTMFRLTASFWAKFWEDDTTPDLGAVSDSLSRLPEIPQFGSTITLEEVRSAVRSLNVGKARGPDMWSNGDIRNFTEDFLENLVHLLNSFSNTGRWPDSLLDATVALLPKTAGSVTVDQTRPITILSALYRLWSRIITRKFIHNAAPFLPLSVQGNRPGASSKWLAVFIQSQVEAALIKNTALHVASLDLTKAFNLISRELLQVTSPRMGVPPEIVHLHLAFLRGLRRSFQVIRSISPGHTSTKGVPEGCGFSVCCMMQLNWLMYARTLEVGATQQVACLFSYVDNWLATSSVLQDVHTTLNLAHDFASKAGYVISPSKTWVGSTCPKSRKEITHWSFQGTRVNHVVHKLELGMLFRFSRSMSIQDVVPRWEQGLARVDRLVHKSWHISRKVSTVRRVVFPQLLSGCESVHVSLSSLTKIRGKLNCAVHGGKTRSSHRLSPLFTWTEDYEPFLYIFHTRLGTLRSMVASFHYDVTEIWNSMYQVDLNSLPNRILGPITLFMWSCQVLEWTLHPDLTITTPYGEGLHLLHSPQGLLVEIAQQCWLDLSLQKGKLPAEWHNVSVSIKTLRSMWRRCPSPPPLSLKYRTLGVLSGSALAKIRGEDEVKCELCGSNQSGQEHLVMHCPTTAHLRNKPEHAPLLCLHPFTRCTGIPCSQPRWPIYTSPELLHACAPECRCSIFTDGSAFAPKLPRIRISGWAVTMATEHGFSEASSGLTAGEIHNIARAETMAVLRALQIFHELDIYCDNAGVVRNMAHILEHGFHFVDWRNHPNSDLWSQIAALVVTRRPKSVTITKVKSHRSLPEHAPANEKWKSRGNDYADSCAKHAVTRYLDSEIPNFRSWIQDEENQIDYAIRCTSILHDISNHVFHTRKNSPPHPAPPSSLEDLPEVTMDYQPHFIPNQLDDSCITWDPKWLDLVKQYFSELRWPPPDSSGSMVSLLELMLDCLISYQILPPVNLRVCAKRRLACPVKFSTKKHTYTLLTKEDQDCMPAPSITDASGIWIRTFDYLQPLHSLAPCGRNTSTTLKFWGYTNVVPSLRVRPTLLSGHAVSNFLESTIIPGVRSLNFPLHLPRRMARQLPPSFRSDS